ncbi:hypothetical protein EHE19_001680 [Ruminiclostridium herbifermentans]|uniref:Uncharacterized protein n=1 Tax=Ruminiclostridium herbifermentans TaxID=2488810 RepID=A0A4U7J6Y1_9FIRM|nr:hypothetical protein [Ruminiclostridium herbifermentans]QNU67282.1 hypothetical protein EHE19_001680 [Ruminiclostridium herbifermentans]
MERNKVLKLLITGCIFVTIASLSFSSVFGATIVRDRFYSIYSPSKFNDPYYQYNPSTNEVTLSSWDYLQYKQNCYGYALQVYRGEKVSNFYKQQPGEFRKASDASSVKTLAISNNPTLLMTNVVSNMKLDAKKLGYTLTEYTTSSSSVAQISGGKRLIAVVTGNTDYHFYIQHSNGTWSHKPGIGKVTNLSFSDSVTLTNSNIKQKANQGAYAGGSLKFFTITKDAVADYPHTGAPTSSSSESMMLDTDVAGEERITATTLTSSTYSVCNGVFDGRNDIDTFAFTAPSAGTYNITTTSTTDIDGYVYSSDDSSTTPLASDAAAGQINMTVSLTQGQTVYIKIFDYNNTITSYTLYVRKN